jgi:hypothetical protein
MESAAPVHTDEMFPVVYDQLHGLARGYLSSESRSHAWQPTDLVHEAWFRLRAQRRVDSKASTHVVALGALAMRRLLTDQGRYRKRLKRRGAEAALGGGRTSGRHCGDAFLPWPHGWRSGQSAWNIQTHGRRRMDSRPRVAQPRTRVVVNAQRQRRVAGLATRYGCQNGFDTSASPGALRANPTGRP